MKCTNASLSNINNKENIKESNKEMKHSNNYELQSKNKYLKRIKENIPLNKQDKSHFEMHKSVKLISKKNSYNKKSNSILVENKIKSDDKKLNKTLNNVKSNESINKSITSIDMKKKEKIKNKAKIINNGNIKENEDKNINTENTKHLNETLKQKSVEIEKITKKNSPKKNNIDDDEDPKKYFDVSNINNIQIPKEYLNIIYYNLLKEEETDLIPKAEYTYMKKQKEINEQMRSILIDWIIDVHFKFGFTDETLFMTVLIIDRYLTINQVSRTKLQLLGITALMIACKHEEIDVPKIDDFIYITDNAYVREEVYKMENDVLKALNFSLLYPSPIKFFEYLSLHFGFDKTKHMMGKYLMESFLLDIKYNKYKSSTISCACTYIVMKFFKMENYHQAYDKKFFLADVNREYGSEYNIKECAKDICLFVDNIHKTNYLACQKKYAKEEQEKVSIIILNH